MIRPYQDLPWGRPHRGHGVWAIFDPPAPSSRLLFITTYYCRHKIIDPLPPKTVTSLIDDPYDVKVPKQKRFSNYQSKLLHCELLFKPIMLDTSINAIGNEI